MSKDTAARSSRASTASLASASLSGSDLVEDLYEDELNAALLRLGKMELRNAQAPPADNGSYHDEDWEKIPRSASPVRQGKWYAVARGRCIGVYNTWDCVKQETDDYAFAVYRRFSTKEAAWAFIHKYLDMTRGRVQDPDPHHPSTLVAFCDSAELSLSHLRAPTVTGACVFPHRPEWSVARSYESRSVNRAVYAAALQALDQANEVNAAQDQVLYVFTRSVNLVRSMTEWTEIWIANGWRTKDHEPVKNRDLLEQLLERRGKRHVIWRYTEQWDAACDRVVQRVLHLQE